MAIELVDVIPGTETPIGDGVTQSVRALVRFDNHQVQRAIVKALPLPNLAAEVFCAHLLRAWGLGVPEVAIARGDPLRFASLDIGYPSLKQRIGWSDALPPQVKIGLERLGAALVSGFPDTPRTLAVDEAINNRDRNLGNVLWDGSSTYWIDHERALGLLALPDRNMLAEMAILSGNTDPIQRAAAAIALTLGPQAIDDALSACSELHDSNAFAIQVRQKLAPLATFVLRRFPQPHDLLYQAGGPQ